MITMGLMEMDVLLSVRSRQGLSVRGRLLLASGRVEMGSSILPFFLSNVILALEFPLSLEADAAQHAKLRLDGSVLESPLSAILCVRTGSSMELPTQSNVTTETSLIQEGAMRTAL